MQAATPATAAGAPAPTPSEAGDLRAHIQRLQQLKQDVLHLEQRAQTDPAARAALQKLQTLTQGHWAQTQQQLQQRLLQLQQHLQTTLPTAPAEATPPTQKQTRSVRRHTFL